jgi:ATP-binding cassette subfamily B protein
MLAMLLVVVTREGYPLFAAVQRGIDKLNTVMRENLAGVRVVKAFVRQEHEKKRFGAANEELMERSIAAMRLMAVVLPLSFLLVNAGVVAVVWFGGYSVTKGLISVGQIMAFVNYLLQALNSMMMVGMLLIRVSRAMASADRIEEVLETEPVMTPGKGVSSLPPPRGRLAFSEVSFGYDGDMVLENVTFSTEPGQKVAILGATGSGKSTLIHLIPRFYDPSTGSVSIDGIDVRRFPDEELRSRVSIVQQDTVLFSGTIRENLRYARPDAGNDEIAAVAKIAQAYRFIEELSEGYDAELGQRGVNLSGGQKQRIAIARALLARPSILVLDDCTSAVDAETEAKIHYGITEALPGTTVVVVAQRISTVLSADKILLMDDGRIIASGDHYELIGSSPIYRDIYDSQLGGDGVGG